MNTKRIMLCGGLAAVVIGAYSLVQHHFPPKQYDIQPVYIEPQPDTTKMGIRQIEPELHEDDGLNYLIKMYSTSDDSQ